VKWFSTKLFLESWDAKAASATFRQLLFFVDLF